MTLRHALFAFVCLLPLAAAAAQTPSNQAAPTAVRVYLDCSHFCDSDFTRTEVNYVNWVRDRADAQVHVIVSRLMTGGGGRAYTLTFTGLRNFAGREDTLHYTARLTDSDDIVRRGLTRALSAGLVPFIVATAGGLDQLRISWAAASPGNAPTTANLGQDPWNYWVLSVSARSNFDGESSQHFVNFNGNVSANRTTNAFKIRIGLAGHYRESEFTYETDAGTDTTVVSIRRNYSIDLLGVKSYGPHWSAGLFGNANSATFGNIEVGFEGGPALEYSLWPYSQATRRSLAFRYGLGISSQNYRQLTIYGQMAETHPKHTFTIELDLRERFGSVSFDTEFNQYLHNTGYYSASVSGSTNIKLFKGLSLNFFGNYQRVRDQLSLEAADLTPEEVLLQQKQLRTNFRYSGGFGIGYSFGSIFNNVVNPRFGD